MKGFFICVSIFCFNESDFDELFCEFLLAIVADKSDISFELASIVSKERIPKTVCFVSKFVKELSHLVLFFVG